MSFAHTILWHFGNVRLLLEFRDSPPRLIGVRNRGSEPGIRDRINSDLDTKENRLGQGSWATEGPTENVAAVVDDNLEHDSGNLRSGLQRVLKKSRARIPKVAETDEHPSPSRRSTRHRS